MGKKKLLAIFATAFCLAVGMVATVPMTTYAESEDTEDGNSNDLSEEDLATSFQDGDYTITDDGKTRTIVVASTPGEDITTKLSIALDPTLKDVMKSDKYDKHGPVDPNKPVVVKLSTPGNYTLNHTLHISGYTTLDVTGSTLTYTEKVGPALMIDRNEANSTAAAAGYGDGLKHTDINIVGGNWVLSSKCSSSAFRMAHAKNVSITGASFSGGKCAHLIEVCAIDGFTVKDCTFKDMGRKSSDGGKNEALQLDIPVNEAVFKLVYQDGTPMKNVSVTGCTFANVPRGVGSHSMLVGTYFENIDISNNTFTNIEEEAIIALNYKNCTITNNTCTDVGAGILVQAFKAATGDNGVNSVYSVPAANPGYTYTLNQDMNMKITGNNITLRATSSADEVVGIKVYGRRTTSASKGVDDAAGQTIPAGEYCVKNVEIKDNNIDISKVTKSLGKSVCFSGIHLMNVKESVVSGININAATSLKGDGINVGENCNEVDINNINVSKATRYGIIVQDKTNVKDITDCVFSNTTNVGIYIYQSTVGSIEGNTVTKSGNDGIKINDKATVDKVANNKVVKPKGYGIMLDQGATVTGNIEYNTIDTPKKMGIHINKNSSVASIIANTIKKPGQKGIQAYNGGVVKKAIVNNTITSSKSTAISIGKTKKAVIITGNTIKKCGSWPIIVEKGATGAIGNNKYSGCKPNNYLIKGNSSGGKNVTNGSAVKLSSAKSAAGKITAKWSKADGAAGYVIEVSTDKTFDHIVSTTVSAKKNSGTVKGLDSGVTYYVRVASFEKIQGVALYGKYSAVKEVTVK